MRRPSQSAATISIIMNTKLTEFIFEKAPLAGLVELGWPLVALGDALLPKLLSGDISVPALKVV